MKLNDLRPDEGARSAKKRLGRGIGSGLGKTSGKGHKGQNARAGGGVRPGFEGGQMPLQRRLPKRGFRHEPVVAFQVVNIGDVAELATDGAEITPEWLREKGLIRTLRRPVKILAQGELERRITVRAHAFSASAKSRIEAAGGSAEVI